jgi:hypothetical protein
MTTEQLLEAELKSRRVDKKEQEDCTLIGRKSSQRIYRLIWKRI